MHCGFLTVKNLKIIYIAWNYNSLWDATKIQDKRYNVQGPHFIMLHLHSWMWTVSSGSAHMSLHVQVKHVCVFL